MRKIAFTVATIILSSSTAFAESCSSMKGTCLSSYSGADQVGATRKCEAAATVCVASCKKGNKVFIGPFSGANHPVTTCS